MQDIILLFTDGEPIASNLAETKNQADMAHDISKALKEERDIRIIGLAAGKKETVDKFKGHIIDWSSKPTKDNVFEATLEDLNNVVEELVDSFCPCNPTTTPSIPPGIYQLFQKRLSFKA